jgi:hypothetical protein
VIEIEIEIPVPVQLVGALRRKTENFCFDSL